MKERNRSKLVMQSVGERLSPRDEFQLKSCIPIMFALQANLKIAVVTHVSTK
jgi:hypothetical protein